jgi:hypothetical protein
MPVIATAMAAVALETAPLAMASAVSLLTAPCCSSVARGTPSIASLAALL